MLSSKFRVFKKYPTSETLEESKLKFDAKYFLDDFVMQYKL